MGLKCSVIGHKYGEAEVEREREEQGSEVVITIQERETCKRCGKTRVVSENKEVTAIETPSDIAGDMIDDAEPTAEAGDTDDASVGDDSTDDATADSEAATEAGEQEPVASGDDRDEPAVDAVDPDADDAEILDDDDDEAAAGGDSELEDPSTEVSVAEEEEPPLDAEASAVANDPEEDDGMIIDGDDEDDSPVDDRQPGEWPDEPDDDGDDWTPETVAAETDEEESDVEPFGGTGVTVPNGQFSCPECDFTTDVASSSLRAGDFCPECHKGALVNTAE